MIKPIKQLKEVLSGLTFRHYFLFLLSSILLAIPGLFEPLRPDDYSFHFDRLNYLAQQMEAGVWYPIVNPFMIEGYGYANDLFYGNFYFYPFALLIQFGIPTTFAFFLLNVSIHFLTFILGYIASQKLFQLVLKTSSQDAIRNKALLFTTIYFFFPFRIDKTINACLLAELMAGAFLPVLILGIAKFLTEKEKRINGWLCLSFSCLLLTHLISFLIGVIFFAIVLLINFKKWMTRPKKWLELISTMLLTVAITSGFLFSLLEQFSSNEFYYQVKNPHGPLSSYAIEVLGEVNHWVLIVIQLVLIGVVYLGFKLSKKCSDKKEQLMIQSLMIALFLTLMMTDLFPWSLFDNVFPIKMLQFTSRLANLTSFFFSILFALLLNTLYAKNFSINLQLIKKEVKIESMVKWISTLWVALFILFAVFAEYRHNLMMTHVYLPSDIEELKSHYDGKMDLYITHPSIGKGEYLPSRFDTQEFIEAERVIHTDTQSVVPSILTMNGIIYTWEIQSPIAEIYSLSFPVLYYKGYEARLNDVKQNLVQDESGKVSIQFEESVSLKPGDQIELEYVGTPIQHVSRIISFIILGCCELLLNLKMKIKRRA